MNQSGAHPGRVPRRLHGVVTALVTPLSPDGRPDLPALERLIERQVAAGVHGLFVLGSVGEGPLLGDAEYREVARCAARAVRGRSLLLGGASDNSVGRVLERLHWLAEAGVAAGVLTLPYYGWPPRVPESVGFFRTVAARSPLPIVAYDLAKAVGWQMPPALVTALFEIPNLLGLKCTHGDFAAMAAIAAMPERPAHFSFLPGNSRLAGRLYAHGADGVVSTPANVHPEPFVAMYRAAMEGRFDRVAELDQTVVPPLADLIERLPTGAASIKAAFELKGWAGRHTVPPWPQAGDQEMETIRQALAAVESSLAGLPARDAAVHDPGKV